MTKYQKEALYCDYLISSCFFIRKCDSLCITHVTILSPNN